MAKGKFIKVVVLYYGDDWHKDVPIASEMTRVAFEDWHKRGMKKGVKFYRANFGWYDQKKRFFLKAWAFRKNRWMKINKPLKPDVIFDKISGKKDYLLFEEKKKMSERKVFFNHPIFRTILDSKFSQYLIFGDFMAKTLLANNEEEYLKAREKMTTDRIVVKPIYGSGGAGIIIDEKEKIETENLKFPSIVQEFIDCRGGIPGFSKIKKEIADLRMVFIDHKMVYALSRIAKEGSFFTNFHQGAKAVIVPTKFIPQSAKEMAEKIIKKLSLFSFAHYSLDFVFDQNKKPVLIEMNTTPGFDLLYVLGDEEVIDKNIEMFIKSIKKQIETGKKNEIKNFNSRS